MRILVLISALLLASCGVDSTNSSSTDVSISFGESNIATGAIGAAGSIPANIQSVSVVALNAAGTVVAGPIIANRPNFTIKIRVPNGNSIRFRILAYSQASATGVVLYETLSAPVDLKGKPVAVPVKMNLSVKVIADKSSTIRGGTVNLTGKVSGNTPDAASPLQWINTGGSFTVTDTYGAARTWQAPNNPGQYTIAARIDPNVNPDQDPTIKGSVNISVLNRDPYIASFTNTPLLVTAGASPLLMSNFALFGDLDGDILQVFSQNKPSWVNIVPSGTNPLIMNIAFSPSSTVGTGVYTFEIGVTDVFGGNITQTINVTVTSAPTVTPAPVITKTFPSTIGDTTPFIYGIAPLGSVIDIYADGLFAGQTLTYDVSDGGPPQGGFSYTFTSPLTEATHVFTAYATLNGIRSPVSNSVSVTIVVPPAPSITTNNVLSLTNNTSVATITPSLLETTDPDTSATGLSYTITTLPTQGSLSITSFITQASINAGLFQYTPNTGASGVDSFAFEVTDGTTIKNGVFHISYNFGIAKTIISAANNNNLIAGATCNATWDAYGSPYEVQDNVGIASGCTLTVQAGVILKSIGINNITNKSIIVNNGGTLNINGSAAQPVIFTTINDDSIGGDTNANGNATSPISGQGLDLDYTSGSFGSIAFLNSNYGDNFSIRAPIPMQNVTRINGYFGMSFNGTMNQTVSNLHIEHNGVGGVAALAISGVGTNPVFMGVNTVDKYSAIHEAIIINGGANPTFKNFTVDMHSNGQPALIVYGTSTTGLFENNIFQNASEGVRVGGGASPTLTNNIIRNSGTGIFLSVPFNQTDAAGNVILKNNKIVTNGTGLNIANTASVLVENNLIRGNTNDGIIVGTLNQTLGAIQIRNNLIGENITGVYVAGDASPITDTYATIQSNTIGGNTSFGLLIDQYTNVNLLYNILSGNQSTDVASQSNTLNSNYNLTTDGSLPTGTGLTDLYADPQFAPGFYLNDTSSAAVDAGPVGSDLVTANLTSPYAQASFNDVTPLDLGYHHTNPAPVIDGALSTVSSSVLPGGGSQIDIRVVVTPKNAGGNVGAGLEVQVSPPGSGFVSNVSDLGDGTYDFLFSTFTPSPSSTSLTITANGTPITNTITW